MQEDAAAVDVAFDGELWLWRGPAPWHFITVPPAESEMIADLSGMVTYGWGMIPVTVGIGGTTWSTSLWPKDGAYLLPVKADVRRRQGLELGDVVGVRLSVDLGRAGAGPR